MDVGLHISTLGDAYRAVKAFSEAGGEAAQVFSGNPKSFWASKSINEDFGGFDIPVVAHAPYVLNMAYGQANAFSGLLSQLSWASKLGIKWLVVHAGSSKDKAMSEGVRYWREAIRSVLDRGFSTKILIENMASGREGAMKGSMGRIETLVDILSPFTSDDAGICLDTAHAWASGEDLGHLSSLGKTDWIPVVHANLPDIEVEYGCHLDRHGPGVFLSKMPKQVLDSIMRSLSPEVAIVESSYATVDLCKSWKEDWCELSIEV